VCRGAGEEKTLGLTIETGKSSTRKLDEKIQLDACGDETKVPSLRARARQRVACVANAHDRWAPIDCVLPPAARASECMVGVGWMCAGEGLRGRLLTCYLAAYGPVARAAGRLRLDADRRVWDGADARHGLEGAYLLHSLAHASRRTRARRGHGASVRAPVRPPSACCPR
jgi:hypothetical protein